MRALLVGDIHLADHPPSIRTDDYKDQILAKLKQTIEIAEREMVNVVILIGDVFHNKAPSRTSHDLVQAIMATLYSFEVPVATVPGNHDLSYDRLSSLRTQPLGVLYMSGATVACMGPFHVPGSELFGVPWLSDWQERLPKFLAGIGEDCELVVAHTPIMPPGVSAPFDYVAAEDFAEMIPNGMPVFYGHIHENHGVYEAGGSVFCNFGAISRGSLHEESVRRRPAVAVFDSKNRDTPFKRIELDHLPPEEVFKLAVKEAEDFHTEKLGEFLDSVGMTELEGLSIEAVLAHIKGMGLDSDTLRQVSECLEVAMEKEPA